MKRFSTAPKKREHTYKIRLSDDELKLFKRKAQRYQSMSVMIRDAVRQFNDVQTKRKIEALVELKGYYVRNDNKLSWLGSNINQIAHNANLMMIDGKLSPDYYQNTIMPTLEAMLKDIRQMKYEEHEIYSNLLKL